MQRVGVFVCWCGSNIAGTVDVVAVSEALKNEPGVVFSTNYQYMCSQAGQDMIKNAIAEHKLTGIVVCSCSPRMHEATFRKTAAAAGLNPYMVEIANIREQCSWVHKDIPVGTEKAIILGRAAIAKVNLNAPLTPGESPVTKRALVIGGGIAGIQTALDIATGETITGVSSWNAALRHSMDRLKLNGITGFIDHGGHKWSAEAYVAMDIRTTVYNTGRAAVWETNQNFGNDLYIVSYHDGARPLCYPWQNKVISSTNNARVTYDLDGNEIPVIAQSDTSYGQPAGLFGINCKHYPSPFIPGVSVLYDESNIPSEAENEKIYEQTQQQRALERKIREEKRDLLMEKARGADDETLKAMREKIRQTSDDIDKFCDETGLPRRQNREGVFTQREFPAADTYDVTQFERKQKDEIDEYFRNGGAQQGYTFGQMDAQTVLQSNNNAVIMNSGNELFQQNGGNDIPARYEGDFTDFEPLSLNAEETAQLNELHQKAIGTGNEYGIALTEGGFSEPFTSGLHDRVLIPDEVLNAQHVQLYHAHTNATTVSAKDMEKLTRPNVDKVAVKAINGDTYAVSIGNGYRPTLDEFMEVLNEIEREVDFSIMDDPEFFDWTVEQRNYMAIREQAFRVARHFKWTLEGGRT